MQAGNNIETEVEKNFCAILGNTCVYYGDVASLSCTFWQLIDIMFHAKKNAAEMHIYVRSAILGNISKMLLIYYWVLSAAGLNRCNMYEWNSIHSCISKQRFFLLPFEETSEIKTSIIDFVCHEGKRKLSKFPLPKLLVYFYLNNCN